MLSRKPKKIVNLGIIFNNNNNNNNNNKCFLKYGVRMWNGFIRLRIGSSSSSGEYGNQPSVSTKCGICNIIKATIALSSKSKFLSFCCLLVRKASLPL